MEPISKYGPKAQYKLAWGNVPGKQSRPSLCALKGQHIHLPEYSFNYILQILKTFYTIWI
jgi:hypothetical protein